MIPRYQRVLFWVLAIGSLLMALFLLRGCRQAHKRLSAPVDPTPIAAPNATSSEDVTLYLANDIEGSISPSSSQLSLPSESTARARALLNDLLATYSQSGSSHPLPAGPAVADVFLLDLPLGSPSAPIASAPRKPGAPPEIPVDPIQTSSPSGQLAVVNLHGTFADAHPSGVQTETLTLRSIVGTLHASFPQITQVRFLVDGQPRETLAGHADLLRFYPVVDTSFRPTTPVEEPAQP